MNAAFPEGVAPWPENLAAQYRQRGVWLDKELGSILKDSSIRYPKHIALEDRFRSIEYKELYHEVCQLALYFYGQGMRPQDNVVMQVENRIEFVTSFFAIMAIGARPIVALPAHREKELSHFVHKSGARYLIIQGPTSSYDSFSLARKLRTSQTSLAGVFSFHKEGQESSAESIMIVDRFMLSPDPESELASLDITLDQLAFFQLSGGSTGLSKLIPRSHNGYFYSIRQSADVCQLSPQTNYLAVLPAGHNFTLSSPGVLGVLYAGGTCYLSEYSDPERCFAVMEAKKINMTALVPPLAILWIEYCKSHQIKPSSLELLQVGGARLSSEIAKMVAPILGARLQQVFGMAEGLVCYTRLDDPEDTIISTQGRPMSELDEVKILDDHDQPVEQGEEGHLLTRGPYTVRAYYKEEEHNRRQFTEDGFYRTGDIVVRDEAGNLAVVGRSKDQINRGGEKIGAEEIENILLAHEAVLDVAVVAIPDKLLGEKSCACILLRDKAKKPKNIELNKLVLSRGVASFKIPDKYLVLEDLPKTKLGKINKKNIREIACQKLALN